MGARVEVSRRPLTAEELAAFRGMLQVHARVTGLLDAELRQEHELSIAGYEVLLFLSDAPEQRLRMAEIADRVLLTRSGCTRLVDRLVEKGLVARCNAECDGRGLYAQLTEAGAQKFEQARYTQYRGIRQHFLEQLSAEEMRELGEIWTRVIGAGERG
jgi:DNA-binding MarR family transcriptional regulator